MAVELGVPNNTTPEGGVFVRMINKTGANSVEGTVVRVGSIDNSVIKAQVDIPDPIGVIYENGIADGNLVKVVISGIAKVLFIGNTAAQNLARTFITGDAGYISGYALAEAFPSPPFASDKHFCEIGHVLETRTGPGLAKVNLHFN
jgi:hypothetical protein